MYKYGYGYPPTVNQLGIVLNRVPAVISDGNTVAWYDYKTGITKDGSNFVSAWNSNIGNIHLLQAVGTNQPLLTADGVLFDGVDNFLRTAAFTAVSQPIRHYIVLRQITWTDGDYILDGRSTDSIMIRQRMALNNLRFFAGLSIDVGATPVSTFFIIRVLYSGAGSKIRINANAEVTGNAGVNTLSGLTIGSQGDGLANYSNIEVKEMITRKISDTSTDEDAIYNYLKIKYAL